LESNLASKEEELSMVKSQLECLGTAAEKAVGYLPSSSSTTELDLPNQLEQLPDRIRDFAADKMKNGAAVALAQAKSVFRKMNLQDVSQGFAKDCCSDLAFDLYSEALAHAPNVVQGLSLDPKKRD
jgi:hypothetical protein